MNTLRELEHMADAAETLILSGSDEEVLSGSPPQLVDEVQAIIELRLGPRSATSPQPGVVRRQKKASAGGRLVDFLRQLATTNPELSPQLAASFSQGSRPSQDEAEALAVELLKAEMGRNLRKRR